MLVAAEASNGTCGLTLFLYFVMFENAHNKKSKIKAIALLQKVIVKIKTESWKILTYCTKEKKDYY